MINDIVTEIGCIVLTCILFACPIGLTLMWIFYLDTTATGLIILFVILTLATIIEFYYIETTLVDKARKN